MYLMLVLDTFEIKELAKIAKNFSAKVDQKKKSMKVR